MLQKLGFAPGFNKQVSELGAEGQWTTGNNVRFRYGTPEKIGGWTQLGNDKLTGAGRAVHHWDNNAGVKYAAIGTNRILYVYSGGLFYDIHPIRTTLTGATFSSTSSSKSVTITVTSSASLQLNDIILFDSVTGLSGSTFTNATFEDKKFMVTSIPTPTTFTITMATTEALTPLSGAGSASVLCYYTVGPSQQLGGYGFGTGLYGGTSLGPATTTLGASIADVSTTSITLTSSAAFPTSGEIRVGTEDISFTANDTSTGILSGGARGVNGTTAQSATTSPSTHSSGDTVTNISDYVAWGDPSSSYFTIEPGLWVLDNYGTKLIALIYNGKCFEWDASATNATSTRATVISGAPTASRHVLVSTPDRHLVFFGTETTIGDTTTQDDMFIRFSTQEDINTYTVTAENTAGTQRLAAGSRIVGAIKGRDAIYVWTDTSLFIMQFVGQPFTFSFQQAGTNCGLFGKNACIEVDGSAFWMSENGFFRYSGELSSMSCLVEDDVYDDINATSRDLINCGLNNLFGEINWFYCSAASDAVDKVVTYNYGESTRDRQVWTTGDLPRAAWQDSAVYDRPHATYYNPADDASFDVTGNTDGSTIYYNQETGTDQINAGGVITPIIGTITSGDFDITQKRSAQGTVAGMPDLRGDGEYIMRISKFIPDFISQTGNTTLTFATKEYPNSTPASTSFSVDSSKTFQSTRLRGRSIQLTVANTAALEDWKLGTLRLDIHPGGRR